MTHKNRDVIIDLRTEQDVERESLLSQNLNNTYNTPVLRIPYYKLQDKFDGLDQSNFYWLYCDSSTMSRIQVAHLRAKGYLNIDVYSKSMRFPSSTPLSRAMC